MSSELATKLSAYDTLREAAQEDLRRFALSFYESTASEDLKLRWRNVVQPTIQEFINRNRSFDFVESSERIRKDNDRYRKETKRARLDYEKESKRYAEMLKRNEILSEQVSSYRRIAELPDAIEALREIERIARGAHLKMKLVAATPSKPKPRASKARARPLSKPSRKP